MTNKHPKEFWIYIGDIDDTVFTQPKQRTRINLGWAMSWLRVIFILFAFVFLSPLFILAFTIGMFSRVVWGSIEFGYWFTDEAIKELFQKIFLKKSIKDKESK